MELTDYIQFVDRRSYPATHVKYPARRGAVLTSVLGEELDKCDAVLPQVPSEEWDALDVQRGDFATFLVLDGNGNEIVSRRMLVSDISAQTIRARGVSDHKNLINYYRITITLVSETKALEWTTLPNISFTSVLDTSPNDGNAPKQKTVFEAAMSVLNRYAERNRGPKGNGNEGENHGWPDEGWLFEYWNPSDVGFFDYFDRKKLIKMDMQCPEMQWNKPNLRQVLNDLFYVAGCVPVVENSWIYAMPLSHRGREVDIGKLSWAAKTEDVSDYATELRVEPNNTMDDVSSTSICEYVSARLPSDGGQVLTTTNMVIPTQHEIMQLKSVKLCGYVNRGSTNYDGRETYTNASNSSQYDFRTISPTQLQVVEIDITKIITEKGYHDTLPKLYRWDFDPTVQTQYDLDEIAKYQNTSLYFQRGSKDIKGFSAVTEGFWQRQWTMAQIISSAITNSKFAQSIPPNNDPHLEWLWKVEYVTATNLSASAGRYLPYRRPKKIHDGQKSSFVDTTRLGEFEYSYVDRYGNAIRTEVGYYEDADNLPKIGDTMGEWVLFQAQYAFQRNMVIGNLSFMRNYALRSYYTGVDAKPRSWQIAGQSQSFLRHELEKRYVEFSFDEKDEAFPLDWQPKDGTWKDGTDTAKWYVGQLMHRDIPLNVDKCFLYQGKTEGDSPHVFSMDVVSRAFGRSITMTAIAEDNYGAGRKVFTAGENGTLYASEQIRYTDDNGRQEYVVWDFSGETEYRFANDVRNEFDTLDDGTAPSALYDNALVLNDVKGMLQTQYKDIGGPRFTKLQYADKDSMERLGMTLQIEWCSDTADICIGKQFAKQSPIVNENADISFDGAWENTAEYELYRPEPVIYEEELEQILPLMEEGQCVVVNLQGAYPLVNSKLEMKKDGALVDIAPYDRRSQYDKRKPYTEMLLGYNGTIVFYVPYQGVEAGLHYITLGNPIRVLTLEPQASPAEFAQTAKQDGVFLGTDGVIYAVDRDYTEGYYHYGALNIKDYSKLRFVQVGNRVSYKDGKWHVANNGVDGSRFVYCVMPEGVKFRPGADNDEIFQDNLANAETFEIDPVITATNGNCIKVEPDFTKQPLALVHSKSHSVCIAKQVGGEHGRDYSYVPLLMWNNPRDGSNAKRAVYANVTLWRHPERYDGLFATDCPFATISKGN